MNDIDTLVGSRIAQGATDKEIHALIEDAVKRLRLQPKQLDNSIITKNDNLRLLALYVPHDVVIDLPRLVADLGQPTTDDDNEDAATHRVFHWKFDPEVPITDPRLDYLRSITVIETLGQTLARLDDAIDDAIEHDAPMDVLPVLVNAVVPKVFECEDPHRVFVGFLSHLTDTFNQWASDDEEDAAIRNARIEFV